MFLDDRSYRRAENVVHRGGVLSTRPGFAEVFSLPAGQLQGLTYFRPLGGEGQLVFAVEGKLYHSEYPFRTYAQIPGVQLYAHAERVWFSSPVRSASRNADGTISVISPARTLVAQDGGYTRAAYWSPDGSGHIDPTVVSDSDGNVLTAGTPLGGPIAWSGDRLWVARGNLVMASDISDPLSFTESEYLAEGGYFLFDEDVVALADVPSTDSPMLFVFTKSRTYRLLSGIRDRSTWKSTQNFQTVVFPDVGASSQRGVITKNGLLWWMSSVGLVSYNSATASRISSKLVPADNAMRVSKDNTDQNLSRVALGHFENYLLCSVPSGDKFNAHTWVYDMNVSTEDGKNSNEGWSSVWTGPRPVEWAYGIFNDAPGLYCVSKGLDGSNTLLRAFDRSQQDAGEDIPCLVETKLHLDFSKEATGLDRKRFVFAEQTLQDIRGAVDLKVYYRGNRGKYKLLGEWNLESTVGSPEAGVSSSELETYQAQRRVIRTPSTTESPETCTTCGVESTRHDFIDVGFSLLVTWTGKASLQSYRIFADPVEEAAVGEAPFTETGPRILSSEVCTA